MALSDRAEAAGIKTKIGDHSFRATAITTSRGALEKAAAMTNQINSRKTQFYDWRHDEIGLYGVVEFPNLAPFGPINKVPAGIPLSRRI